MMRRVPKRQLKGGSETSMALIQEIRTGAKNGAFLKDGPPPIELNPTFGLRSAFCWKPDIVACVSRPLTLGDPQRLVSSMRCTPSDTEVELE